MLAFVTNHVKRRCAPGGMTAHVTKLGPFCCSLSVASLDAFSSVHLQQGLKGRSPNDSAGISCQMWGHGSFDGAAGGGY